MNLEMAATSELIEELKSRFDYLVFSGMRVQGSDTQISSGLKCDETMFTWKGYSTFCIGMAAGLMRHIHNWEEDGEHCDA